MKDAMEEKPKKLKSEKMSHHWNFTFFESDIYIPFFQFHVPEVLEWKIAHSLWYKKAQNTEKSPKNDCVTSLRNLQDVLEHPVVGVCCIFFNLQFIPENVYNPAETQVTTDQLPKNIQPSKEPHSHSLILSISALSLLFYQIWNQ